MKKLEEFAYSLGGIRQEKMSFWNPIDNNPFLESFRFDITLPHGMLKIEAFAWKEPPKRPCVGELFANKFSANVIQKGRYVSVTNGFVEISEENIQKYLGGFAYFE